MTRVIYLILIILLAIFAEEGFCRGGRGGGGGSRGGGRSRGGSYRGGGGGYGGSGGAATGTALGIVFGVIGGCIGFSLLVCLLVACCKRCGNQNRANGRVLSAAYDSNRRSTNLGQIESVRRPVGLPPAYSTIDKPVFNVQEEIKTSHLPGNSIKCYPQANSYPTANGVGPNVHKDSSTKISRSFMV